MYKLRIALVLLKKHLLLNFLVIVQLLVILVTVNCVVVFSSDVGKLDTVFDGYADANFFKCFDSPFVSSKTFSDFEEYLPSNTEIFKTNNFNVSYPGEEMFASHTITAIDNGLLTKIKYKPIKGRWFDEEDALTGNIVLSYNDEYKIGDKIKCNGNGWNFELNVIGILKRGENELNFGAGTSASSFFAPSYYSESIIMYASRNFFAQNEGFFVKGDGDFVTYFKLPNELPYDEYLSILSTIKNQNYFYVSAEQMVQFDMRGLSGYMNVFIPLCVLLFAMAFFGFLVTALITFKTSAYELGVVKNLGGGSRDLTHILLLYIGLPMLILGIFLVIFASVVIPLSFGYFVLNYLNYVITFAMLGVFFLLTFALLFSANYLKNKKKGVADEDK